VLALTHVAVDLTTSLLHLCKRKSKIASNQVRKFSADEVEEARGLGLTTKDVRTEGEGAGSGFSPREQT